MTDELSLEGKQYISSKRAAEISGYAQDYVGQLARKGLIDAQRIGGLWYVFMESLVKYKEKAETYVPKPPQALYKNESPDTLISFDGKDYISASRASEITGYHQDYVGQLARGGKILSRQVGNRWYVDREGILTHKKEKDDLLAAVQAQAVGINKLESNPPTYERKIQSWEPLRYQTEVAQLIPPLTGEKSASNESVPQQTNIQIRVVENTQKVISPLKNNPQIQVKKSFKIPGKTIFYSVLSSIIFFTLIIYLHFSLGFFSSSDANNDISNKSPVEQSIKEHSRGIISSIVETIEPYITKELVYIRD